MDSESQLLTDATLFHRTEKGLAEIRHKAPGLTQSERLLLIIIDGATHYSGLREKLKGLAQGRFNAALLGLSKKGLIAEFDSLQRIQATEEFDSRLIAEFLQRDPLDPVTIVPLNAADNYLDESTEAVFRIPGNNQLPPPPENVSQSFNKASKVDFYLPLEQAVKSVSAGRPPERHSPSSSARASVRRERADGKKKAKNTQANYFRYWLIFLAVVATLFLLAVWLSR